MATKIVTKNSSTASAVPTASDLVQGELAVNVADKRLFTEDNTGTIVELGTNPSTIDINAGSIDGTAIGASSASTGAFTTLTATGTATLSSVTPRLNLMESDSTDVNSALLVSGGNLSFRTQSDANSLTAVRFAINNSTGDISFYEDTGTTPKFFWDASAESLGIGTTSPLRTLHLKEAVPSIRLEDTDVSGVYHEIISEANTGYCIRVDEGNVSSGSYFRVDIDNSEKMRIDSSGAVGIGTTSPAVPLHVNGGTDNQIGLIESTDATVKLGFKDNSTTNNYSVTVGAVGNEMTFTSGSGGTEAMRIDSSGNVGIGTTSPSRPLYVQDAGTGSSRGISINTTTAGGNAGIGFATAGTDRFSIDTVGSAGSEALRVYSWTASTERARINSSGDLLVGCTTTPSASVDGVMISRTPDITSSRSSTTSSSSTSHWIFYNANGIVGNISTTGSQTVYATSSDQRLKENIADANDAGSKIDAIQVRKFDWKADGSHQDYGMIAQELVEVAPEAVTVPTDSEEMMGVDYSKLVPMLIKEIQSLRNRVAQLEE